MGGGASQGSGFARFLDFFVALFRLSTFVRPGPMKQGAGPNRHWLTDWRRWKPQQSGLVLLVGTPYSV